MLVPVPELGKEYWVKGEEFEVATVVYRLGGLLVPGSKRARFDCDGDGLNRSSPCFDIAS